MFDVGKSLSTSVTYMYPFGEAFSIVALAGCFLLPVLVDPLSMCICAAWRWLAAAAWCPDLSRMNSRLFIFSSSARLRLRCVKVKSEREKKRKCPLGILAQGTLIRLLRTDLSRRTGCRWTRALKEPTFASSTVEGYGADDRIDT